MTRVEQVDAAVTRQLRLDVLRPGYPAGTSAPGDIDGAIHLAAYDDSELVGAVALLREPYAGRPIDVGLQLSGMAVAEGHRDRGVGDALLSAVTKTAGDVGATVLWCNARVSALSFYESHGFIVEGDEFVTPETGLPHLLMWRDLAMTTS